MTTADDDCQGFLRDLGVELDADERTLRRAYARRLKAMDIEADPAGFQALRETFEAALRWHEQGSKRATPSPASGAHTPSAFPAAAPMDADPAQRRSGSVVAEHFGQFARHIASFYDEAGAGESLASVLAHPALASLADGEEFERLVAERLTGGWQPGHHELFVVAADRFQWRTGRRRLAALGSAGLLLDAALEELAVLDGLAPRKRESLLKVVRRLRETDKPSLGEALVSGPDIRTLLRHHPHWLDIAAPRSHAERWLDALNWPEVAERKVAPSDEGRPRTPPWLQGDRPMRILNAVGVATAIGTIWYLFTHAH